MIQTTNVLPYNKCCYCGGYHNYSPEMCKDMIINQVGKIFNIIDSNWIISQVVLLENSLFELGN